MKNQVEMTPHKLETWLATLSCFDADIVNRVILEIGLSEDPFPDLGKITLRCEALRRRRENCEARSDSQQKLGDKMLKQIAAALGMKISP